ncbi:hypothetical protein KC332_g6212 [Hortaea werneckii]|uniref:Nephrocystin 3-like N-terminal domain-containing protein n=2 Tax=Hortaea werneckii TaxID=91943 RepID=A0A3M7IFG2_HORWE|nr:hypothetical protein KC358_g14276 [Hortaea werneckii]OTA24656.1 hypothetical protein BTJ68_13350 [Hortaea werneckii EXF-2000]KAI6806830.1 hypothetical protein KC350_g13993 [Hortaea werneckii]KAI6899377.1 hypothetical protein KC348_g17161 [Hortaea werneckii]KAI6924592.1 hypothetical protein KC341_g13941 [Hortaea werneckii]
MEVAGSAVGIASLGVQVCQGLLSYYNDCKDYESDISGTRASIADLHDTLVLLEENLNAGSIDEKRRARVFSCLQSCNSGLQDLRTKLDELKKYSKPEGLRQKARAEFQKALYPFRKDTLGKLRGNVADVRERLKLALQVLQLSVQQSDRWRKIVDWLSPPDPWTNHRSARDRHEPHTGDWLLGSPIYRDWKAGKGRHLWICGKAGCGKTVLSSTMIENIKELCNTDENLGRFGLGAFYFTFSDKQKQSYEDLLRSLVEQLAWKQDGYARLQQAFDNASRGKPGKDELEKILLLSLQAYDQVFLALDALDESPEENDIRQTMLEELETLVQNASNVKLLATSREARDIQKSMGMLEAQRINVADSKVDKDIRKYVVSELRKDRRLSRLSKKTTSLIEDTLSARADGMFRWAHCQIQELKKLKSTKPKYIEDVLRTLPKTLDETYDRILCAIEERYWQEALTLLRWITYSKEPLTLRELAEAAIIDPSGEGTVDVDNQGDIEGPVNILSSLILTYEEENGYFPVGEYLGAKESQDVSLNNVSICSDSTDSGHALSETGFNSKVRLAHFSVKEYLESKRILKSTAKAFHMDRAREHRFLAQSCITYLMHYSMDATKLSEPPDQLAYPLLEHSAESWYYYSSLQTDGSLDREVQMLTTTDFTRNWLAHIDVDEHHAYESSSNDIQPGLATYYASYVGLRKVVEELLARGADINTQGGFHGSALQAASYGGYEDIVESLLTAGADVNMQGGYHGSALQAASYGGYKDIVERLLTAGADVNAQGGISGNALQAALQIGNDSIGVVEKLLAAGADVNAQGGQYGSALQKAADFGFVLVVERLLAVGADVNAQGRPFGNALQAALYSRSFKSVEVLERLLAAGADVNAHGGLFGNSALQAAISLRLEGVVERLLTAGANVNAQIGVYGNALQAAATRGSIEVVKRLITAGANVNAQGGVYGNALQAAAERGFVEIVERLLAAGAHVNTQGGRYDNALQAAKFRGRQEVVDMLLAAGAVSIQDDQQSVGSEE